MPRVIRTLIACTLFAGLSATAPGCRYAAPADAASGATSTVLPAYTEAFQRAKDALRDFGFELDRVDARAGIITTRTLAGRGVNTGKTVRGLGASLDAQTHRQQRRAVVLFRPQDALELEDLRDVVGGVTIEVRVEVERVYAPGRRPSPTSVRVGGRARDTQLEQRGLGPAFAGPVGSDDALAARLARAIEAGA